MTKSPLIVALDFEDVNAAKTLINQLNPKYCRLKIGKGLFTQEGPYIIDYIQQRDFEVFLDLKFHDIPTTVAHAIKSAAKLGVWMVNVHASGGEKMLSAAKNALEQCLNPPKLIAVTILTSLAEVDVHAVGFQGNIPDLIRNMAKMAQKCGLDGVVCSAQEAALIKADCGDDFISVCPGIRPLNLQDADALDCVPAGDDQMRIMTPDQAIKNGANYLVIGRPITQANDPRKALDDIYMQLALN